MDTDHVILSAVQPETVAHRAVGDEPEYRMKDDET